MSQIWRRSDSVSWSETCQESHLSQRTVQYSLLSWILGFTLLIVSEDSTLLDAMLILPGWVLIWHPCHSVTFCDIIGKGAIVTFGGSMEHQSWSLFISNILVYMLLLAPSPHLVHQLVGHQISYFSFVIDQIVVYAQISYQKDSR